MKYKQKCERCGQYKSKTYQKCLEKEIKSLRERIDFLEGKEFYESIQRDSIYELGNNLERIDNLIIDVANSDDGTPILYGVEKVREFVKKLTDVKNEE